MCDLPAAWQDPPLGNGRGPRLAPCPRCLCSQWCQGGAGSGQGSRTCADGRAVRVGPRGSRAFAWATSRVSEQGRGPSAGTLLTCPARRPLPSSVSLGSVQQMRTLTETLTGAEFLYLAARAAGSGQPPQGSGSVATCIDFGNYGVNPETCTELCLPREAGGSPRQAWFVAVTPGHQPTDHQAPEHGGPRQLPSGCPADGARRCKGRLAGCKRFCRSPQREESWLDVNELLFMG